MSPFPFLAFARRKPTGLTSAEMAALRCIAAARSGFLLAAAPFGRRAGQPSEGAPTRTARSPRAGERGGPHLPLLGEERTTPGPSKNQNTGSCGLFHPGDTPRCSESGTELRIVTAEACGAVFGQTGTVRVGWCACPWLTLFATEWSAARRKPLRAAAMPLAITNFADVKARRLPTSGRRKFPSGNFRRARDLEGAKRVSRGQAQRANPQESPFARRPHRTPPPPLPQRSVPVC